MLLDMLSSIINWITTTTTISKPYWTAFYRNKMSTINVSELGYLFHAKSSLHIVAWDLDVKRSQL